MEQQKLSQAWTKSILASCTARELLVLIGAYGAEVIAQRLGYQDVAQFIKERQIQQ